MTSENSKQATKSPQPSIAEIIIQLTRRGPIHIILIGVALIWIIPTLGLGVTSFRSRGDIAQSGWWTTISGNQSSAETALELTIEADTAGNNISMSASDSTLLSNTGSGFPSASIGQVNVIEVLGQFSIDINEETIVLPDIGTITLDDDEVNFEASEQFDGYFIIENVETNEEASIVDFRLTGQETIDGQIEIEELNDGVRVPRTGTLTVLPDGSFTFEPRSSFVGTFEAEIVTENLEERPIIVQYSGVRAGGILQSIEAGNTVEIPLAGTLVINSDGSYDLEPLSDFIGTVVTEVSVLNPILTLDNYRGVLEREDLPPPGFIDNLKNSLIITIPSTILPILLAALAAYAFAWMDFPFRDYIYLLIIALLVIPLQTTWVPVLKVLNSLGINGQFVGIWVTHTAYGLPFAIFLLYNFFRDLPREVFEAARIDGANEIVVFFRIVLPLSIPAIASLAIFQFVWVWNDLMNALIFLDRDKAPLTIGIRNLLGQYGNEWHLLAAGAFVTMIIPLIVFLMFQQYFVRGLTAGAVKG